MNTLNILKNTIIRQKEELKGLLSKPMQKRALFDKVQKVMGQSLIKVITGPRRAGKSTFGLSLMKGLDFIYLNFDDQGLYGARHQDLDLAIEAVFGNEIKNIFVDEIQNLFQFELWLNSLHRRGYNIVATGSNAHLLSKELGTHLTGRHIEIEILPFSYAEYGGDFDTFYNRGGFPDILLNGQDPTLYIEGLENSVILKDIVQRYNIRQYDTILALYAILASNVSSLFSYKNLAASLGMKSEVTIRRYIRYLQDVYMHVELLPFTNKTKEFYRSAKKGYLIDIACIHNASTSAYDSKKLENFVCTELMKYGLRPHKNLFYGKTRKGFEIDFMIKKDQCITMAIQVCFDMNNIETRDREIRSLLDIHAEHSVPELLIVTWNHSEEIEVDGVKIRAVPVKEFLGRFS